MKHDLFVTRAIIIASFMVLPVLFSVGSAAAETPQGTRALQNEGLKQNAVEGSQDTLKACLGRIPADASIGQQILAEQNCQTVSAERSETFLTF